MTWQLNYGINDKYQHLFKQWSHWCNHCLKLACFKNEPFIFTVTFIMAIDRAFYSLIKRLPGRAVSILSIYGTMCLFNMSLCFSIQQLLVCNRNQVSVSGIAIKVQFGYRYRSQINYFPKLKLFFQFYFPISLGNLVWYQLQYRPKLSVNLVFLWGHSKTKWSNFVLFWPPTYLSWTLVDIWCTTYPLST